MRRQRARLPLCGAECAKPQVRVLSPPKRPPPWHFVCHSSRQDGEGDRAGRNGVRAAVARPDETFGRQTRPGQCPEGAAVVAMSEPGTKRAGRASSSGSGSDAPDVPDVVEQLKELKDRAVDAAGAVRESASGAAEQVKQRASEMTRAITGGIAEEAGRLFEEQKGKAASKVARYGKVIHQSAHALRAVKADGLAEYVDAAADKVEGINEYLEERTLAQVLDDAGEVARSHPGMMLGGMFVAGFALARFLKSSADGATDDSGDDSGDEADAESGEDEGDEESPRGGRSGRSSRGGR